MNAALVAESAGTENFWVLHDALFANQDALDPNSLIGYATTAGVLENDARGGLGGATLSKIERDMDSGNSSGVQGTPTFFINGNRHEGDWSRSAEPGPAEKRSMSADHAPVRACSDRGRRTPGSTRRLLALAMLSPVLAHCGTEPPPQAQGGDPIGKDRSAKSRGSAGALPPGLAAGLEETSTLPHSVVLDGLSFQPGSSTMPVDGRDVLDAVSAALEKEPGSRVRVVGYGEGADDARNAALGLARAESVKAALLAHGVSAFRVETTSGSSGTARRATELVILSR